MEGLFDLGLEQSVLSILLNALDADVFNKINLLPNEFYAKRNQIIYQQISDLAMRNEPFDGLTVLAELKTKQLLDAVGGDEYLNKVMQDYSGSPFNASSYSKRIKALAKKRQIYTELLEAQEALLEPECSLDDIWGKASSNINNALIDESIKTSYTSEEAYELWADDIYERSKQGDKIEMSTGFVEVDKMATIEAGNLVVIAARSSMGKTTLSQNIFTNVAKYKEGVAVYFSIEMSTRDLTARIYSDKVNLEMDRAFKGKELTEDDWAKIFSGVQVAQDMNFVIDDRSTITTGQMRTFLNKVKQEHGKISGVFIDYMQLIKSSNSRLSRVEQVTEISGDLKSIAKDFNCPVWALSQLNRDLEKRPNKRPIMSDLRESGAIEQDADVIMFIYRDEYYNPETEQKNVAEIILGKNRNGERGTAILGFDGKHSRFTNQVIHNEFEPFEGGSQ